MTAQIPLEHYLHYEAKTEPNLTRAVVANAACPEEMGLKVGDQSDLTTPTDHLKDDLGLILVSRRKV